MPVISKWLKFLLPLQMERRRITGWGVDEHISDISEVTLKA